jgi:hypothetical protein
MQEICFCGRAGEVEDREPVALEGGGTALRCPSCGHADPVKWLAGEARAGLFERAGARKARRGSTVAA